MNLNELMNDYSSTDNLLWHRVTSSTSSYLFQSSDKGDVLYRNLEPHNKNEADNIT